MNADIFYDNLIADVINNEANMPDSLYDDLRQYYRKMYNNESLRPFYRYNWQRRTASMVNQLQVLPARDLPWRVLDAGCGVGTESLYWATVREDLTVLGVDAHEPRIETAAARLPQWKKRLQRPLSLHFQCQNIFKVLAEQPFDLIWSMEAISHIDPAESFLSAAWNSLTPGGRLVISDSHLLNPAMAWRIYKMRRRGPLRVQKTLTDGRQISYANERLFAVSQLTKILRQVGYTAVFSQLSIYFPPQLAQYPSIFWISKQLDRVGNKLPLLRQLGGIYTIVAVKT